MKIYLAYRDGYRQNTRFIKEFEADSILSWFQINWECFGDDGSEKYSELMRDANIYGFRIGLDDDESFPDKPKNFDDLKNKLNYYFYVDPEVIGDKECLQVPTDDDEIQLAWFMFTEKYKNENWDKLSLWFAQDISTNFGLKGKIIDIGKEIKPRGSQKGQTYFISCSIYDSMHLTSLSGAYLLKGVRLSGLVDYLRLNKIEYSKINSVDEYNSGFEELKFLQLLSKKVNTKNIKEILELSNKLPYSNLWGYFYNKKIEIEKISIEALLNLDKGRKVDPTKSIVNFSEHFCELSVNIGHGKYNYSFLFDDLWIEKNQAMAKSIIRFGTTWKI